MIRIAVRDIKSSGVDIDQTVPASGIDLTEEEVDIRCNLHIKAHVYRADNTVMADTTLVADFGYLCARCLEDFHVVETREYEFDFEVDPSTEYVDVGEEVRQEIIMANPSRVLCKDDCQGICPKCGVNLNIEKCRCTNK